MTSPTITMRAIAPAKAIAVFIALLVALACIPSAAYATSTKVVKKQGFSMDTSTIEKKATAVKKGTTKLVVKAGKGYIKFKAPATKKYAFTFTDLKAKKKGAAYIKVLKRDTRFPQHSFNFDMRIKGGLSDTICLGVNGFKSKSGTILEYYLPTRTATTKLKKGESIYFYFNNGSIRTKFTLKVQQR